MRDYIKKVSEYCAELFDEVILDDFYFTNCTCEDCVKAKGDRTWVEFRKELMRDVSENLVVSPAKKDSMYSWFLPCVVIVKVPVTMVTS